MGTYPSTGHFGLSREGRFLRGAIADTKSSLNDVLNYPVVGVTPSDYSARYSRFRTVSPSWPLSRELRDAVDTR